MKFGLGSAARAPAWRFAARVMGVAAALAATLPMGRSQAATDAVGTSIYTYHYDNLRTGWNKTETTLTPATVSGGTFKLHATVTVDEQVDAQPLMLASNPVLGHGVHNTLFIATENNTVYAVDGASGLILISRNLGAPVPATALPGPACNQNSTVIGINSTPVIDPVSKIMYLVTYTEESGAPVFRIHALNTGSLADVVPSVVISGSQTLSNGQVVAFNPAVSRQRPALLLANGNIYAGFGSFCDHNANTTRGWMLGWQAGTLTPLSYSRLIDRAVRTTKNYYMSSLWMSGAGPAADASGNIYFITGNSDPFAETWDPVNNLAESVVEVSSDLSSIVSYFTPSGTTNGLVNLDVNDLDFGSGGILLLPTQTGAVPNMAVAAGKVGEMYVMTQGALGGYVPSGPDNVLASEAVGPCWCGESYFVGSDGISRIVSSGGLYAIIWALQTTPSISLSQLATTTPLKSVFSESFMTSVSSNGTTANTAILWAVTRPTQASKNELTLYAYNPLTGSTLYSSNAGTWISKGRANTVPVVANGYVYVASYKQLQIFGL